ncbi:MAG: hypothetical protein ABIP79_11785, partial [Chitinophagaceae bacterium]
CANEDKLISEMHTHTAWVRRFFIFVFFYWTKDIVQQSWLGIAIFNWYGDTRFVNFLIYSKQ